jgi:protein-tyrosine phosphatase
VIDTHCHLLPHLDDGPASPREALELAQALVDAGVRVVVCTPHYSRRYRTDHDLARGLLESMNGTLARAELPIRAALAAEVSPALAVEAPPGELRRRRLGDRYLLVELESDTPVGLVGIVRERLDDIGLTPVFAHPERCRAVRSQPHVLDSARESGAMVQVVARSLAGGWGKATASAAWHLLESGRVDLLASDAHGARHAGKRLAGVLELITGRLGAGALVRLAEENPAKLLDRAAKPT